MAAPPSFKLRLIIEGTCALVPDDAFFKEAPNGTYSAGKPTSVTVLLPDMRAPRLADWEQRTPCPLTQVPTVFFSGSHAPALLFAAADLAHQSNFSLDGSFSDPSTRESKYLHILDREVVSLLAPSRDALTFSAAIPPLKQTKPLPGDTSLWWIPRMSEISAEHQWASRDLLTIAPSEFTKRQLAARFEITQGALSIIQFNSGGDKWHNFGPVARDVKGVLQQPPTGDWGRAVGNVLLCEIEVLGSSVTLDFNSQMKPSTITLQPSAANRPVEVRLVNAELENVVLTAPEPPWITPSTPDPDFQGFYPLTTGGHVDPWPVPLADVQEGPREKPCCMVALSGSKIGG